MQEKRFRSQISWLMFGFSILVIWVHSYNVALFAGSEKGAVWERAAQIETFWSVGIGQIAVPGFFMLSSYLFFRNFKMENLIEKWKSRCFSVLIPYIVWNLLYYFGYVIATRLPLVQHVVGKDPVPFTIEEILRAVLQYGYAPIFWYLFQLIILLALAPQIYLLVKNRIAGILYLAILLTAIFFRFDTGRPNMDALFYFSFGAYMAVHHGVRLETKGDGDRVFAGLLMLIAAVYSYGMMKEPGANILWTIVYRWFVPAALWLMTSCLELPEPRPWMRQSLFLYAIHFIVVRFMNKGAALFFGEFLSGEGMCAAALWIYFAIPAVVIAVSYVFARVLAKWMPPVWRILSGGRNL